MAKSSALVDTRVICYAHTGEQRTQGFFVAFGYSEDALHEIDAFFRRQHITIRAFTVQEIVDSEMARKLA